MEITTPALAQPQSPSVQPTTRITSDFDTFLRMLTVQIQNQDPMNPMQSSDFAVQLATFAGVEQQIRSNQLLSSMSSQLALGTVGELAGWIGMDARVAAPVGFQGGPVELSTTTHALADRAVLVVRNGTGDVLAREPFPLGQNTVLWQGQDATGAPLASGRYELSIESYAEDSLLETRIPEYYARVDEARIGPTGAELLLENGLTVTATQITALRRP